MKTLKIIIDFPFFRTFRKNWKNLSAKNRLQLSKGVTVFIGGFGGACLGFYFFHLEESPVTHRTRFMPISHKQMVELTEKEYKNVLEAFAEHILPTNHPDHVRVFRVATRLLLANLGEEMNNLSWQVNVVESDEINAFVLPVSSYNICFLLFGFVCLKSGPKLIKTSFKIPKHY